MNGRLRAWWALPGSEKTTLLWLMVALPLVSLLLRLAGYVRARALIERWSPASTPRAADPAELQSAERLARLAAIAGRRGAIAATCLRQSLLLHFLLRRRGLGPELKLGVRKHDGNFDAHSWVELQGQPLAQDGLDHVELARPHDGATGFV